MKRKLIVILFIVLFILLFPFQINMKDDGTKAYRAALYTVYDVHRIITSEDEIADNEYIEGIIIEVFGVEVFNNTNPRINI